MSRGDGGARGGFDGGPGACGGGAAGRPRRSPLRLPPPLAAPVPRGRGRWALLRGSVGAAQPSPPQAGIGLCPEGPRRNRVSRGRAKRVRVSDREEVAREESCIPSGSLFPKTLRFGFNVLRKVAFQWEVLNAPERVTDFK